VETLPNGRADAAIALEGRLEWLNQRTHHFEPLPVGTLFPATTQGGTVRSLGPCHCLGIKFKPALYAVQKIASVLRDEPVSFAPALGDETEVESFFEELRSAGGAERQVAIMDQYLARWITSSRQERWLHEAIALLESDAINPLTLKMIAAQLEVNIKTLERRFKKSLGMTPKAFSLIHQLQCTLKEIHQVSQSYGHLGKNMGTRFHDQSHFIRTCQRITGKTPKTLVRQLVKHMSDLAVVQH
jgi:AraC-like DNA-binding protein